ncbi:MAG: aminotransferase class IV [Thermoanaerobaculia bacterium]
MSLAWWNGRTVPREEVGIDPSDAGFLFGDGIFETLRVDQGSAWDVAAHLERLLAGLVRLRMEIPEDAAALEAAVREIAFTAPEPVARLRITVSRGNDAGPTRLITTAPYEPPDENAYRQGVPARFLPQYPLYSGSALAGLKSLSYQTNRLALRAAEAHGAWEAILVNEAGRLVEGSRSNLAVVLDGSVLTPRRQDGCLPGTVRRRLLERGVIQEWQLAPEDLAAAGEVLLMNSLVGVLPVSEINGKAVPLGATASYLRQVLGGPWSSATGSPAAGAGRRPPA